MDELTELDNNRWVGAVLTKSCTVKPRDGNPKPRYAEIQIAGTVCSSINSNGLCNLGYETYSSYMTTTNKPYLVSVAGPSLNETLTIVRHFEAEGSCDGLELNMSCPNLQQQLQNKCSSGQLAYDKTSLQEYLRRITESYTGVFGVKLPPYWFPGQFDAIAEVLNEYKPSFVTCCNSLPNGLYMDVDTERPLIKPRGGFGGIGGTVMKPIGLANVCQFRSRLHDSISLVGCGGVASGADAFEYLLVGADAVQIGTAFMARGHKVFETVGQELEGLLRAHGYQNVLDVQKAKSSKKKVAKSQK
jgi:dihydroorotate dehydrogenase (fumarate)